MSVIQGSADDIVLYGGASTLWSGTWSSGSITVPNTDKYRLFQITMSGQGTTVLAMKNGTYIRGIGGYSSGSSIINYYFSATISGNTWTFVSCESLNQTSSNASPTDVAVTSIVGII